jgi:hypothetical protein
VVLRLQYSLDLRGKTHETSQCNSLSLLHHSAPKPKAWAACFRGRRVWFGA